MTEKRRRIFPFRIGTVEYRESSGSSIGSSIILSDGGARDGDGKIRRRYRRQDVATPYEKLKSLPDAGRFLKPGVTFGELDKTAYAMSDLHANRLANRARDELFRAIGRGVNAAA